MRHERDQGTTGREGRWRTRKDRTLWKLRGGDWKLRCTGREWKWRAGGVWRET